MNTLLRGLVALAFASACSTAPNARPDASEPPDAASSVDSGTTDGDAGVGDAGTGDAGVEPGDASDAGVPCTAENQGKAYCCGTNPPHQEIVNTCTGDQWSCRCVLDGCDLSTTHVVFAFDLPLHCGPSLNTPEPGVPCGNPGQVCAPGRWCCDSIADNCRDTPDGFSRNQLSCDGPEDCAGQLCCADVNRNPRDPTLGLKSACAASCGVDQVRLCNVDADCGDGLKCCAGGRAFTGLCRASCLE